MCMYESDVQFPTIPLTDDVHLIYDANISMSNNRQVDHNRQATSHHKSDGAMSRSSSRGADIGCPSR